MVLPPSYSSNTGATNSFDTEMTGRTVIRDVTSSPVDDEWKTQGLLLPSQSREMMQLLLFRHPWTVHNEKRCNEESGTVDGNVITRQTNPPRHKLHHLSL